MVWQLSCVLLWAVMLEKNRGQKLGRKFWTDLLADYSVSIMKGLTASIFFIQ